MNRISILLWSLLLLMAGCRDNFDITTTRQLGPIPEENVQASLIGHVVDTQGNSLEGVQIEVAGQSLMTDVHGLFYLHQKLMNKNGAYVKATRSGFFHAGRFAFPRLNKSTYLEITMIPKTLTASFQSSEVASFSGVRIPANAIANAQGQPYTGQVNAYVVYLNPTDPETFNRMPGDLRAQDAQGYAKVLISYGMIGVELESPLGEKLNLLAGQTATISMDVAWGSPETIPIWHFDETSGYWKEEGEATLTGNVYKMEVPHFSYWNCDTPADYTLLTGRLTDTQGHPLANYGVTLSQETFGTGVGNTDGDGYFGGIVPANVTLDLKVYNICGEVLHLQTVGPLANQTSDIGTIVISDPETITTTGTLVDCNGNPLPGGLAMIERNDTILAITQANENGQFTVTHNNCISFNVYNIFVTGYDLNNLLQSEPTVATITNDVANAGTIPVCSNLDEYLVFSFNGVSQTLLSDQITFEYGVSANGYLGGWLDTVYISLNFENLVNQQATVQSINGAIRYPNNELHNYGCSYCGICPCGDISAGTLQFTEVPAAPGEYAAGSVTGMIREEGLSIPVPYSVQFRIKME